MLPSRKALSMKLWVASAFKLSSAIIRSSSSAFFAAINACHCASTFADAETESTNRSEEHTSELQSLMRISYAVFCLKKKKETTKHTIKITNKYTTVTK